VAVGPGGAVAGGAVAARRGTYYVSGEALRTQGSYVRTGFRYYNTFTPTWYGRYPAAWRVPQWTAATVWAPAIWPSVATFCAYDPTPVYYDYGTTVVYEGDTVYFNGEPAGTADEYAQQAIGLAGAGRTAQLAADEEWKPLGVYAVVRGEEEASDKLFQLAVTRDGVIRGNYYDAVADNTLPVYGSVDRQAQRAAWSVGDKKDVIFEAGVANLTNDETPILVHHGKDNTQQFTLVRVEQPAGEPGR
jgi:hypothetical protein